MIRNALPVFAGIPRNPQIVRIRLQLFSGPKENYRKSNNSVRNVSNLLYIFMKDIGQGF